MRSNSLSFRWDITNITEIAFDSIDQYEWLKVQLMSLDTKGGERGGCH